MKEGVSSKNRKVIITILILGLVVGSVAIVVIPGMISSIGAKKLELKKGLRYEYLVMSSYSSALVEIYGTKESENSWEGISVGKSEEDKMVVFGRFKIGEKLNLSVSKPLGKEEVLDESIGLHKISEKDSSVVMTLAPFAMLIYNEAGLDIEELIEKRSAQFMGSTMTLNGPVVYNGYFSYEMSITGYGIGEEKIYISTEKPYMLIGATSKYSNYSINKVEQKAFDLDDYREYEVIAPIGG